MSSSAVSSTHVFPSLNNVESLIQAMIPYSDDISKYFSFLNNWYLYRLLSNMLQALFYFIFTRPLAELYIRGPKFNWLGEWGGWEGIKPSDICAKLTPGVSADFWNHHSQECFQLIKSRFYSFLILIFVPVYFFLLIRLLQCILKCIWCSVSSCAVGSNSSSGNNKGGNNKGGNNKSGSNNDNNDTDDNVGVNKKS
jgi:hypothetical protein